jgi:predicted dehydrogenase
MGRNHVRVAQTIDDMQLVAVADPMGDTHHTAGNLPVFTTVDELISFGIDAAIVSVPTALHREIGLQLSRAGVHALIEKPVADSLAAGQELVDAFANGKAVGAVGHIERFNPALMSLRSRLQNGDLGEVYQIQTRRQGPFPARIADVGVMKDLGSHDIDLTSWLSGSAFERVFAQTTHRSGREHEDMITVSGTLRSGIITNHVVNWLTPFKERFTLVTGERGAYLADTLTGDLTFFENGIIGGDWQAISAFRGVAEGSATRFALNKIEPLRSEQEAFRDLILGKPSQAVTLLEGLDVLRVCEASLVSAATGESVKLENSDE